MKKLFLFFSLVIFSTITYGGEVTSFPPPVTSYEVWDELKKHKSNVKGFNLPHFGTDPHTIFFNSADDDVTLIAMFSGKSPPKTEVLWYLMVSDYNNPGRHSSETYDAALRDKIEAYTEEKNLPSGVTLIHEMGDIHWVTIRLKIPAKHGLFAVPYPKWNEPLCKEKNEALATVRPCRAGEDGHPDIWQLRHWLLSIEN